MWAGILTVRFENMSKGDKNGDTEAEREYRIFFLNANKNLKNVFVTFRSKIWCTICFCKKKDKNIKNWRQWCQTTSDVCSPGERATASNHLVSHLGEIFGNVAADATCILNGMISSRLSFKLEIHFLKRTKWLFGNRFHWKNGYVEVI